MKVQLVQNGGCTELELAPGLSTLGGGEGDAVRAEGMPPGTLSLWVEGDRLALQPARALRVGPSLCATGVRRLLVAGEWVELSAEIGLRLAPPSQPSSCDTRAMLENLLASRGELPATRAPTLTVLTGPDLGRTFPIATAAVEIGRAAALRLRDRALSRHHARIRQAPDGYWIDDLGGPNRARVNGEPVPGSRRLQDGDVLALGRSLIRFSAPGPIPSPLAPTSAGAAGTQPNPRRIGWVLPALAAALAALGALLGWGLSRG